MTCSSWAGSPGFPNETPFSVILKPVETRKAVYFLAPCQVALQEEELPPLGAGQARVKTQLSAISSGTELLVYRGLFPENLEIDSNISALAGKFHYPLKYGYCAVGQIIEVGAGVEAGRLGQWVFSFQPHESLFNAAVEELLPIPHGITPEDAVFLPNMETAVNLVMDGKPLLGEQALVFGQGIIGLLTTALLARFPLTGLVTLDRYPLRRQASMQLGVRANVEQFTALDPAQTDTLAQIQALQPNGADLTFELSGSPEALDQAIGLTGFEGRLILGSWYGQKRASLNLGGRFHRSRIRLISSQVSTLSSELSGRWTKARRFQVAWQMLRLIQPSRFITHHFALQDAPQAYQHIDRHPEETIQVVINY